VDLLKHLRGLKQQKAELITAGEQALAIAAKRGDGLTDEEKQADDTRQASIERLDDEITRISRIVNQDRAAQLPQHEQRAISTANGDPRCGYRSLGEFAREVMAACAPGGGHVSPRLQAMQAVQAALMAAPSNYMQEASGSSGDGYMVPPQFKQEIFELIFADAGLLEEVDSEPTNSSSVELDADETTPWGSSGVLAKWRSEAAQMTATKADTDARLVKVHDLYAFVTATDNLMNDAPRLSARLTKKAAEAIRYKANDAVVNGDGVGKPLGWLNAGCLVTQTKESGQAAATFVAANAAKMFSRLLAGGLGRSAWYVNSDVLPQLFTMTLGNNSVFVPPADGFTKAPGGFLFGRPVRPVEHCKTLGTKGDVAFVDPKGYYAPVNGGLQYAESIHLYFDYGMRAFRWTFRMGGQPYLAAAVSPANGSVTKSHFVVIETRS
jgi:HK97 family phage major capsid protein